MKIATIGLGYIGLPTAVMFAKHGQEVIGFDTNKDVIASLQSGRIHIEEPGLQEAFQDVLDNGLLRPVIRLEPANVFIIAVPTPHTEDHSCDTRYIRQAVKDVIPLLEPGNTIILESTVAPKTTTGVIQPMLEESGFTVGVDVHLVHCPERVLPGQIMTELVNNNRIIGGVTPECTVAGSVVYRTFVKGEMLLTDASTAELSKLMENTFRDTNIALANELVKLSAELGINALDVIEMANKHPRVNIHTPGPGVGGHCLAVDPYFITTAAPEQTPLIQTTREINSTMPKYIADSVDVITNNTAKKVVILGAAYKGNVDDIRESPALKIAEHLQQRGVEVHVYDPHVTHYAMNPENAFADADMAIIATEHDEFKRLPSNLLTSMASMRVFDTKNIFEGQHDGLSYITLGTLHLYTSRSRLHA
ncbi:nucleotide sugar dehydrogenase [Listeria booriae]|uniref:nucleotide sugar dehydrogenase n=1 Tax=Listeria booriae TaxID=1552123 RepID=UPI0016254892|nr:nucleotide sugar dehydrogenase [Listeria booriae]MBC2324844.1 nucleotide sugar dehydrogenase [Listeria booriae]MCD2208490.1 nucleotide sugar dehydrogenase [Listeria booriae]